MELGIDEGCTFSGWLAKKSSSGGWKPKFFRLWGNEMRFYNSPEDTKCRGSIEVLASSRLAEVRSIEHCLKLTTNGRTLLVQADSAQSFEVWKQTLWQTLMVMKSTEEEGSGGSARSTQEEGGSGSSSTGGRMNEEEEGKGDEGRGGSHSQHDAFSDPTGRYPHGKRADVSFVPIAGVEFALPRRYKPLKPIGVGAFGAVISSLDYGSNEAREDESAEGQPVAIKKISKVFRELLEAKRLVREIRALSFFTHPNIISIIDILPPAVPLSLVTDVYVVTDLMETDLHRVIASNQALTLQHVKYFMFQILCAVDYVHSCGIIHRDIKPSNILINQDCTAKLCDFGLCRSYVSEPAALMGDSNNTSSEEMDMTQYVVTRWYRAPEIMLCHSNYTTAIDIWSVGCIFGELLCRRPLFPGKDYIEQLTLMTRFLGSQNSDELSFIDKPAARRFMRSLPKSRGVNFLEFFEELGEEGNDLLKSMLRVNPEHRAPASQCLEHPFLEEVYDERCVEQSEEYLTLREVETAQLTEFNLKSLLVESIIEFNPSEEETLREELEELGNNPTVHRTREEIRKSSKQANSESGQGGGEGEGGGDDDERALDLKRQMRREREKFRQAIERESKDRQAHMNEEDEEEEEEEEG